MRVAVRLARPLDAAACARIVNDWIDATDWIARSHSRAEIAGMIERGIPMREFWVGGDPVAGYLSFDPDSLTIMGLYTANPGQGVGKALVDRVKEGRDWVQLWTHALNVRAHRFYEREGFALTRDVRDGADGIPEWRMEWRRDGAAGG